MEAPVLVPQLGLGGFVLIGYLSFLGFGELKICHVFSSYPSTRLNMSKSLDGVEFGGSLDMVVSVQWLFSLLSFLGLLSCLNFKR